MPALNGFKEKGSTLYVIERKVSDGYRRSSKEIMCRHRKSWSPALQIVRTTDAKGGTTLAPQEFDEIRCSA
ncbi:MAG: hypothetical protein QW769_02785 [Nitrososphaerales archaeon]